MPDEGIGYGLLRHLNPRTRDELAAYEQPQFGFNYLGRTAVADADSGDARTGDDWSMSADGEVLRELGGGDPQMPAPHAVSLNVVVEDGPAGPRLVANWTWPRRLLEPDELRRLADGWFRALTALADHAAEEQPTGLTPSDLSLIDLELDDLGVLEAEWRKTQ
ncbi:non-ribosomal peptide synthase protein (TIGR01720 family) [Streptomyces calvus]